MNNKKQNVYVTELVLRDAHQCLIATRMKTEDMLPICEALDEIGFWSLEVWGGATYDSCLRYLKEDPWERLKNLKKALPKTPLLMLLRGQSLVGYRHYPDDVVQAFVEKSAQHGIDIFRIFDALNDIRNLEKSIEVVKACDKHAQGTISYTTSPVHKIPQFVDMAKALSDLGCDSICIKDMAGLLTPTATVELFTALHKAIKIPVHLHSHSTSGLASICHYKAIECGCRHIDTAISPFSQGASHPPTESLVAGLQATPFDTKLDMKKLENIANYFRKIRPKYHQFESEATKVDPRIQLYQVPGGMISNLYQQLKDQDAVEHYQAVLDEIPKVRKDLGYPPLVTPSSQVVGAQAVLNILTGERYKTVTKEVKLYLQGYYGKAPGEIDPKLVNTILDGKERITDRPADHLSPEMDKVKKAHKNLIQSEEDVITLAVFPEIGKQFIEERNNHALKPEVLVSTTDKKINIEKTNEFRVTYHGESYEVTVTGTGDEEADKRPFYLTIDGVPEEVLIESESNIPPPSNRSQTPQKASQPGDITVSMPSTIVSIQVKTGDTVKAGDVILVVEAMKMETEIEAPIAGTVQNIHAAVGELVNPNMCVVEIRK